MHDNETLASLRRNVFVKLKASPCSLRLELANGQEPLDTSLDRHTLSHLGVRDKAILNAKLSQVINFSEFNLKQCINYIILQPRHMIPMQ